jgi:hypothetical protein
MRDKPIPPDYWNLSASVYAFFFIELTKIGIDVIGESQLVGFPTQYPDVSMINPDNSKPNARFWVLKLIKDNFSAGDALVSTGIEGNRGDDILAQGFITDKKSKKILILNKRNKTASIKLPAGFKGASISTIDQSSGDNAAGQSVLDADSLEMKPYAVSVITLP